VHSALLTDSLSRLHSHQNFIAGTSIPQNSLDLKFEKCVELKAADFSERRAHGFLVRSRR